MEKEVRNSTKKMLMYFIVFSISMLFAGLISAYIVSSMGQYWVHINPPGMFLASIAIIAGASVAIVLANRSMKKGSAKDAKSWLLAALILGFGFTYTQYSGWQTLASWGGGWSTHETDLGEATSWNKIDDLLDGSAVYGVDYEVRIDDEALIYDEATGDLFAPNDPLMVKAITTKVKHLTNTSNGYLWVMVMIHILHLSFGLIYLIVNLLRVHRGSINSTDHVQLYTLGTYWHFLGGLWIVLFFIIFSV
jgi:heme/copper-type cytochrome/quinol oxidase subunit 3